MLPKKPTTILIARVEILRFAHIIGFHVERN
jgi:hypothetical protein